MKNPLDLTDTGIVPEDLDSLPIERAETIPSRWYTDDRFGQIERSAVFGASWQLAGRMDQVEEPGSVLETRIAGNPIILVRDREGVLRAFFSVCRHRGGPLRICPTASDMLQCRYHGWTYRLDGSLRGVPRFDRAELFDKNDYGLREVQVDTWSGKVFVNLSTRSAKLGAVMRGIRERIDPINLDELSFHSRVSYDIACNWKVYVDNYLEGYHLPYVHPELCDVLDLKAYRTELGECYSLQYSPIDAAQNPYHVDSGGAFYYFVFPNLMLNILPGRLQTNLVVPMGPDRCLVHFDYFYSEDVTANRIQDDLTYSDQVQQEDIEICERVQEGLQSIGYDKGRFSVECEQGVWHFQSLLKNAVAGWLAERRGGARTAG